MRRYLQISPVPDAEKSSNGLSSRLRLADAPGSSTGRPFCHSSLFAAQKLTAGNRDCRFDFTFVVGKASNHAARHADPLAIECGMHRRKRTERLANIYPRRYRCKVVRQVAARCRNPKLPLEVDERCFQCLLPGQQIEQPRRTPVPICLPHRRNQAGLTAEGQHEEPKRGDHKRTGIAKV